MGEMPHLKALVERHPDDFVVFGVNTDDDADEYRAKAVEHGVTWPDVFAGSTDGEIPRRWGVTGYPTMYVLDRQGVIRSISPRGQELERVVDGLLAAASLAGTVIIGGELPERPAPLTGEKEHPCCPEGEVDLTDRSLLFDDQGRVANVVVELFPVGETAIERSPEARTVTMRQKGCRLEPHIVVIPAGGTLRLANADSCNANLHTYARRNAALNVSLASGAQRDTAMEKAETFEVKNDLLPWVSAYVIVTDAPYHALTDEAGAFRFDGVPPGDYSLRLSHERLGRLTHRVQFRAGVGERVTYMY